MGFAIIFSVFIAFSEYVRGNILGGFPWNTFGYIWSSSYILLQPVALIGIYGLGLVSILAITSISLFKKNFYYGIYAVLPLLSLLTLSYLNYHLLHIENKNIKLRLVQPNILQEDKWNVNLKENHFKTAKFIKIPVTSDIFILIPLTPIPQRPL